ncbi:MAG: hypothetical protein GF355_13100 [Candidatus Eisenbacteria bacterium]|nr:hypothetical protein [Candidatus Eisenbacteria bacterium]
MRRMSLWAALAVLIALAPNAHGEVASALIREGDPLPGGPEGFNVNAIDNTAVNTINGWAVTLNSTDGMETLDFAWGDPAGGGGSVLFAEGSYGAYAQTSWESFFGFSDAGLVAYSASSDSLLGDATGLDGVWLNDQDIAVEEQPYPHQAGMYWSFASRPGATGAGSPHWVGGFTDSPGGSTQNRGLYIGADANPLVVGGDMIGGLPDPVDTGSSNISFDYRISALGSRWIAEIATTTGSSANNNHMVIDKSVIVLEGLPVSENGPVPAEIGGLPDEVWDNFDYTSISETGRYMFTGDTGADTAQDEFILIDGIIVHREGDMLDGEVLSGSIEGAYMNEVGDYAFIWDIEGGGTEALFVGDQLILREGDVVDWDGDEVPDADHVLTGFTGISTLTLSERLAEGFVRAYFTADVMLPNDEELEAAFVVPVQVLDPSSAETAPAGVSSRIQLAARPNPAPAGRTEIQLTLPETGPAELFVTDVSGRVVRRLAWGRTEPLEDMVRWNGRDDSGAAAAPGIYFIHCVQGENRVSRRLTVVR